MILETINGYLLDAKEEYIAQQCNCVTVKAHGLSAAIAKRFPYADLYSQRSRIGSRNCTADPDIPGTIKIAADPECPKKIICMFAQWTPGKPSAYSKFYPKTFDDSYKSRKIYFKKCLDEIDSLGINRIAMPYLIGCGLAGGIWKDYETMLKNAKTPIVLYKLN